MSVFAEIRFRKARLEDIGKVTQLEKRVWRDLAAPYEQIRRRFFCCPQAFWVAATRLEVAGVCCGVLTDQDASHARVDEAFPDRHVARGKFLFLVGLTVNPIFRNRGIAGQLVDREIEVGRRFRCRKIQLVANRQSSRVFEFRGFERIRRLESFHPAFPELMQEPILMELKLATSEAGSEAAEA